MSATDTWGQPVGTDMHGHPLAIGDRVKASWDREEYTGTVELARSGEPGLGPHTALVVRRDGDGAQVQSFTDMVAVIR